MGHQSYYLHTLRIMEVCNFSPLSHCSVVFSTCHIVVHLLEEARTYSSVTFCQSHNHMNGVGFGAPVWGWGISTVISLSVRPHLSPLSIMSPSHSTYGFRYSADSEISLTESSKCQSRRSCNFLELGSLLGLHFHEV